VEEKVMNSATEFREGGEEEEEDLIEIGEMGFLDPIASGGYLLMDEDWIEVCPLMMPRDEAVNLGEVILKELVRRAEETYAAGRVAGMEAERAAIRYGFEAVFPGLVRR